MTPRTLPNDSPRRSASFQTATLIYDATSSFCEKCLDARSRLADQMQQAARSARLNAAEGSRAPATPGRTELRLLAAARIRLEELRLDYEDYLRHRRLQRWSPDSPDAAELGTVVQKLQADRPDWPEGTGPVESGLARWLEHPEAGMRANAIIVLIHHAQTLLDQQITATDRALQAATPTDRAGSQPPAPTGHATAGAAGDRNGTAPAPTRACPQCGKPMVMRTAKTGRSAGKPFWGCSGYPDCKAVAQV